MACDDWDLHWREYNHSASRNPAQNYRRELILTLLAIGGSGSGTRILDLGSGQGDMAAAIHERFPAAEILGLELSQAGVEFSRTKVPAGRFIQRNLLASMDVPAEQSGWATHAVCSEVVEHLENPVLFLKNARRYMAADCRLVLTVPGGPMSAFDKHIGHRKHWRRQEIERLLRESGFVPESVSGAGFPFFNLYRCLVIMRGKKLIDDVRSGPASHPSRAAVAAMAVFDKLIRPHLNSSRHGWQMVATARCSCATPIRSHQQ